MLCQGAKTEDVTVVPAEGKDRRPGSARLQRHDGALLLGQQTSRAQELQNLALVLSQLFAQLRTQYARRGAAAQPRAVRLDLDVPVAERRQ
jgi:hypothetical protein